MKNLIVLSGKLPAFEGKYVPATGDKKSRMNWAINTQLSTKNANGYYDEILVNFTVWGYYADLLQQINVLPKDDPTRKKFMTITLTGKFVPGYKDKEGNLQSSVNIEATEFEFTTRLPQANNQNQQTGNMYNQAGNMPGMNNNMNMPGMGAPGMQNNMNMPGMGTPGMGAPGMNNNMGAPGMSAPGMQNNMGMPGMNNNMGMPGMNNPRF